MTILLGFQGEGFVVLAADQLVSGPSGGRSFRRAYRRKMIAHPELPVAVALAGVAEFGRGAVLPVHLYVTGRLKELRADGLSLASVFEVLAEGLQERLLLLRSSSDPDNAAFDWLRVTAVVAVVGRRGAEIGSIECRATCERNAHAPNRWTVSAPRALDTFLDELSRRNRAVPGERSPELTLDRGRALVAAAIEEDERCGLNQIGGGVDGIVVDARGARRLDSPLPVLARHR